MNDETVQFHNKKMIEDKVENDLLSITPTKLFFGVVSSGFYYNLKFSVKNVSLIPIRIRIVCNCVEEDNKNSLRLVNLPDKIAPGMIVQVPIELAAEVPGVSMFTVSISQNVNSVVYSRFVEANVVSPETFKYVKKSLQLQKRPIYRPNVTLISSIPGSDFFSMGTSSTTFSEALIIDDEDLDDMLSFPITSNVYWDPFDKCLRIDPLLSKVYVDSSWSLDDSIYNTELERMKRNTELEEQGFLTQSSFQKVREGVFKFKHKSYPEREEEINSKEEEEDEVATKASSIKSRLTSVSSLLAVKRDKIEQRRRSTVIASSAFAKTSSSDPGVNSMRTLQMIQSRNKLIPCPTNLSG